jgi:signal transduction histidine kinase
VASILGFTETILDNPAMTEDTRRQFIEKSHAQAERLTALLQDISTLNRMDYAADVLTKERVDISALFADIAGETALALHRKQMTLRNCLQQGIIVEGNLSLIYSIFRNLMDNAINYAGQGTAIEVSAQDAGSHWQFTFADNGTGIAQEHLPRIFERFYRIDKGRSRSLGGTGLGLAIVKNAVQLHGGTIIAHETNGGGLTFEFYINK